MEKDFVVLSINLANDLIEKGYKIKRISKNRQDQKKLVFYFEYSDELKNFVNNYKNKEEK